MTLTFILHFPDYFLILITMKTMTVWVITKIKAIVVFPHVDIPRFVRICETELHAHHTFS